MATSNYPPPGLLPASRHHVLVLPRIGALQEHCDVLAVAKPVDTHGGARPGWFRGAWADPGSASQPAALGLAVPDVAHRVRLAVGGWPVRALTEDDRCVQFDVAELCSGTRSVGDLFEPLRDRGQQPAGQVADIDVPQRPGRTAGSEHAAAAGGPLQPAWQRDDVLVRPEDQPCPRQHRVRVCRQHADLGRGRSTSSPAAGGPAPGPSSGWSW